MALEKRLYQEKMYEEIMQDESNVLAVLPPGGGKSHIFGKIIRVRTLKY
jgi:superfamily II DNA or RNA helicase